MQGKKIVLNYGYYNVLNIDSMKSLYLAWTKGDKLIVAVSDTELNRNVNISNYTKKSIAVRMETLSFLDRVDIILPIDKNNLNKMIKCIRPNVYVIGDLYSNLEVFENSSLNTN